MYHCNYMSINIASSSKMSARWVDGNARVKDAVLIRVRGYMKVNRWVVEGRCNKGIRDLMR